MKLNIANYQEKTLKALAGKIEEFYLGGGTALSLYYFHHRESLDLDFFTKDFYLRRIKDIIEGLSLSLKKKIGLIAQQNKKGRLKIAVYAIQLNKKESLKMDFIEDYIEFIKPPKTINGINILSLEDIYIRKIYAIAGTIQEEDLIGRKVFRGGRQEAKDFYDLYCLSNTFKRLSDFAVKYCTPVLREGIIRWFRTYSRFEMKTGLLELKLRKAAEYMDIERHFKKEIDAILQKEIG